MALTQNTKHKPDAVTLALWRAVEVGEFREVEAILPRVADINARNEHGVTALMRAAQHGHARVVRLLLANGADANVIRNDKFTALSLAAFFGHTEVVRALMEHGADSKASTRNGTSPHMWATARTFNEVVAQLKRPAPVKREERAVIARPAPAPFVPTRRPALVLPLTTGRPAPEIPAIPRVVPSMKLTFRIAMALGLVIACVVGVMILRGAQAHNEINAERRPATPEAPVHVQTENPTKEQLVQPVETPAPFVAPPVTTSASHDFKTASVSTRSSHSRAVRPPPIEFEPVTPAAPSEKAVIPEVASEKSEVKVRSDASPGVKTSSHLSPHLITPAKTDSPKKKVIQWP